MLACAVDSNARWGPVADASTLQESTAPPPRVPCAVRLPNLGNEGHSYLAHMERRHGSLAPLTLFLPDTMWNDGTLAKPHFTHDIVVRAVRATLLERRC